MARSRSRFWILIALVAACGESPTAKTDPTPNVDGVVSITVSPANAIVAMGSTRTLVGTARDAAGAPVTATLTWQTSAPGVATVDATGKLTAVAVGEANVTASVGSITSAGVAVSITDNAPWPTTGEFTSGQLINAALENGTLTEEQALIYEVFASFMDARLPPEYRGMSEETIDNPILMVVAQQYPSLSASGKATLAPFFVDPGYQNSWFHARYSTNPNDGPVTGSAVATKLVALTADECRADLEARGWKTRSTAHFAIHYGYNLFPWAGAVGEALNQAATSTAAIVEAEAEKIYAFETSTFGREPMSDASLADNGCDGLTDIWIYNIMEFKLQNRKDVQAKAIPYLMGACKSPSRIHLMGEPDAKKIRNALAHEFFHVLEMGAYTRSNCLSEYFWLGEATGNWAMDLVYPDDQFEHNYAAAYVQTERFVPIDEPGELGKDGNGYTDYIFLLYLSRGYGNAAIKDIWDATEGASSVEAIAKALESREGIQKVWPEFALTLWNDYKAGYQDDLNKWDKLEWGMKKAFDDRDAGGKFGKPSIKVVLEGGPNKSFEMLQSAKGGPQGQQVPRLSIHADYFKFTEDEVASVVYLNALGLATIPNLKIQALIKKGGQWQEVEDWTTKMSKSFCRDFVDERIEELVLITTNSDGTKSGQAIPFLFVPNVGVSNVGCAKWEGTASIEVVVTGLISSTQLASVSNFVLERERDPAMPFESAGSESFTNKSGAISATASGTCMASSGNGLAEPLDASLIINLDNLFFGAFAPPPDREIVDGQGGSSFPTTLTNTCTGDTNTSNQFWSWFEIPTGMFVSADGRTIEGNVVETSPPGVPPVTKTIKWKLTAVREP